MKDNSYTGGWIPKGIALIIFISLAIGFIIGVQVGQQPPFNHIKCPDYNHNQMKSESNNIIMIKNCDIINHTFDPESGIMELYVKEEITKMIISGGK